MKKNPNGNSRAEKCNWIENFSTGAQQKVWTEDRISTHENNKDYVIQKPERKKSKEKLEPQRNVGNN